MDMMVEVTMESTLKNKLNINLLCTFSERVFNTPFMSCSRSVLENADEEMWELYFYCEKADDLPSFVNKWNSSAHNVDNDAILTSDNISINCV